MMALKQPSPEVFDLFDDVMLLSEGVCVYHGPCEDVQCFFGELGFQCPPRMAVPGFLQNITSRMDQQVYTRHCTATASVLRCTLSKSFLTYR